MRWKPIVIFLLLAVALLNGVVLDMDYNKAIVVWIINAILIVAVLVSDKISKAIKESRGVRFVVVAIATGLVLIPLVLFGTCLLALGGTWLKQLFVR